MTKSDIDLLLEMGFEQARAELAVKKTGGCQCFGVVPFLSRPYILTPSVVQQALNWLEANQDKPLEELQAATAGAAAEDEDEAAASIPTGENAMSLVCNDCGKKFRTHDQASFHAAKTLVSS